VTRRRALLFLGPFAAALLAAAGLRADQRLPLRRWVLRLPGTELGLAVADVDGDGARDLVVAHMRGETGQARSVSVYLHGPKARRFSGEADHRWDAPADACAFGAGDVDGDGGAEVVFVCPRRLVVTDASGTTETDGVAGFFDYPERGGLPEWDLLRDLDGDGDVEVIAPTRDGYTIFDGAPDGLVERSRIDVPPENRFGPSIETRLLNRFLTSSSRLQRVVVLDLDADGRLDLVAYREGGLARFLQRPDGTFPERPDDELPIEVVEAARSDDGGAEKDAFANVRLGVADVDGDGRAELIVSRTTGEVGVFETMRTQHAVFRGREDGAWDQDRPDALLNLKGVSGDPRLDDWDGDGRLDLIASSYRMDLFTNVKRAIFESMTITYLVHLQREEGLFGDDPDFVLDVEVPLESLESRGGTRPVSFAADLDGDGVNDMVAKHPDGGLRILRGGYEEGVFSGPELTFLEGSELRVRVDPSEPPRVVDLDGDGKDELILEPFGGEDLAARTVQLVGVAE